MTRYIAMAIGLLLSVQLSGHYAWTQEAERISKLPLSEIKPKLVQLALELFEREKMNDCVRPYDSIALSIWKIGEYGDEKHQELADPKGHDPDLLYYVIEFFEKVPSEYSSGNCFVSFDDKGNPITAFPYTYPYFPDFYAFQWHFFEGKKQRPLAPEANPNKKGKNGE